MPTLEFKVSGQHIERVDNVQPVAKSREYIDAHFEFLTPEWAGIKTAIFSSGNGAIRQPLDDNGNCVVPWEFWDTDRDLTGYVSVFCGDLVTADRAPVRMYQSGYQETDESREPTPDEYKQMVAKVEAITKECNELLTKLGKKVDDNYETLDAKKANIANPVFSGSVSMGRKEGSAVGEGSAAIGVDNVASGKAAYAEGSQTQATGKYGHAEGEGTKASGECSHAEGSMTEAASICQHVQGKYNVVDTEGKHAHIVGNGTSSSNRSNAHTVDWNGNGWFAGKLSQEGTPIEDKDLATKKYVDDNFLTKDFAVVNSWADVQRIVRQGLGRLAFPVGYEFTTYDSNAGKDIVWVVRGHNYHKAADEDLQYTMTLETKDVYSKSSGAYLPLQFSPCEAFYYASDGLAAGTYNFTGANQPWSSSENGAKHQFTITKDIPAGGHIILLNAGTPVAFTTKMLVTFSDATSVIPIEASIAITLGEEGTCLGTTDGSGNLNNTFRMVFGSNNYAQSPIRQWLNGGADASSAWSPTTKFSTRPSWANLSSPTPGFTSGLPEDFLGIVQPAIIPCRTNDSFEVGSLDGTVFTTGMPYSLQDKFFLLARAEVLPTTVCDQLEYYENLTSTELKKYDVGKTVRAVWFRSYLPPLMDAYTADILSTSGGSVTSPCTDTFYGVCPACIIA